MDINEPRVRHFVEEVGLLFEEHGAPRMMGRILGWLLVCDPPHQSSAQIADALYASKGSISTNTRSMMQAQLIERVAIPGQRSSYFRIRDNAWANILQRELSAMAMFRELAESGLELMETHDEPLEKRQRLQEFHDMYAFMEGEFPRVMERFLEAQKEKS